MNCIPAGMELWPSNPATSWEVIRRVIDRSDYYVLIIGGMYGSTNEDGISYTEQEYDYARELELPVLAFVHGIPYVVSGTAAERQAVGRLLTSGAAIGSWPAELALRYGRGCGLRDHRRGARSVGRQEAAQAAMVT